MMNEPHGQVFVGQAGWDDEDVVAFPGTMEDDGHTLVRCQLFSGRDVSKEHTPDRAQGTKLVCHIADHVGVPVKGASVYMVFPHGMEGVAGAALIVGVVTPGPERKTNLTPGDKTISCVSGPARVRLKQDGSVTLFCTDDGTDDGKPIFLRISKKGLEFGSPFGNLKYNSSGFHVSTAAGPALDMGGIDLSSVPGIGALPPAVINALTGYITFTAPNFNAECSNVVLGSGATSYPVMYCPLDNFPSPNPGCVPPSAIPGTTAQMFQAQNVWIMK